MERKPYEPIVKTRQDIANAIRDREPTVRIRRDQISIAQLEFSRARIENKIIGYYPIWQESSIGSVVFKIMYP